MPQAAKTTETAPALRSGADGKFAKAVGPNRVLRSGADSKFAKAIGPNDHKWRAA